MMYYRSSIIIACTLLLSACSSYQPQQRCAGDNCGNPNNPTDASLAEASYSVSRSIVDLAESAQAAHPTPNLAPSPSPATYGMGGVTTVDWTGPIEPLVQQIAKAANYRVLVLGTRPAIPVIVSIYAKNQMLGDILRDVGYQGGDRAAVVVFPGSRLIEIRYAKN